MTSGQLFPLKDEDFNRALQAGQQALCDGELIAIPTETVYGLAADAENPVAVANIFRAKGRPQFNPLICHLAHEQDASRYGIMSPTAKMIARACWPGPLTLVVPRQSNSAICQLVTAGLDMVGLRVPRHSFTRELISQYGRPLAAPSANRSGHISATQPSHIIEDFGQSIKWIFDDGPSDVGLESSIFSVVGKSITLLRHGAVTPIQIESLTGITPIVQTEISSSPIAPGQLKSHYAPNKPVRLNVSAVKPDEALLAFGDKSIEGAQQCISLYNLSKWGDLQEAASCLFEGLRALDKSSAQAIACAPIPSDGLGAAINDRLQRAAAPR